MRCNFKSLFFMLLPTASALATPFVPMQRMPGDFSLDVEWLYLSPPSESRYFAVGRSETIVPRQSIPYDDFFSGYRLGTAYTFCESSRFISFTWTSLQTNKSRTISPLSVGLDPELLTTVPPSFVPFPAGATAIGSHKFNYYAIDGVIGQRVLSNCYFDLDMCAGVHYAHFITSDHFLATGGTNVSTFGVQQADFWGVGPELGMQMDVPLWRNFALVTNTIGGFIVGSPRSSVEYRQSANLFNVENDTRWRMTPFFDMRLGLNYNFCFSGDNCFCNFFRRGFRGSLEVGYEGLVYFDALSTIVFPDDVSEFYSFDDYRNVTMHGPYVAFNFNF